MTIKKNRWSTTLCSIIAKWLGVWIGKGVIQLLRRLVIAVCLDEMMTMKYYWRNTGIGETHS
jgi:hypothetical protein